LGRKDVESLLGGDALRRKLIIGGEARYKNKKKKKKKKKNKNKNKNKNKK
jgi:hypothetical protein